MILIVVFHLTWQVHPISRRATPFRCECGSSSREQKFHSQRETLFCMIDCAFIESTIIFCLCLMALISRSLSRLKRELSFLFPFDYSFFHYSSNTSLDSFRADTRQRCFTFWILSFIRENHLVDLRQESFGTTILLFWNFPILYFSLFKNSDNGWSEQFDTAGRIST